MDLVRAHSLVAYVGVEGVHIREGFQNLEEYRKNNN